MATDKTTYNGCMFFMDVLKAGLWNSKEWLGDNASVYEKNGFTPQWELMTEWARKQTVMGVFTHGAGYACGNLAMTANVKKKVMPYVMNGMKMHELLNSVCVLVSDALKKEGIDSVLLKGQGLARVYDNPKLRQCGDIDIYVGEENYGKACEVLEKIAVKIENNGNAENHVSGEDFGNGDVKETGKKVIESEKHYHRNIRGVCIEIHRRATVFGNRVHDAVFAGLERELLDRKRVTEYDLGNGTVNVPPAEFDALFVFIHAWSHFMSAGVGLRQVCDWTLYIHRFGKDLDAAILEKRLSSLDLLRAWRIFGCLAVKYLGLPQEECPLYSDRYERQAGIMFGMIWEEGNFGFHSNNFIKANGMKGMRRRFMSAKRILKRGRKTFLIDRRGCMDMMGFYIKHGARLIVKDLVKL